MVNIPYSNQQFKESKGVFFPSRYGKSVIFSIDQNELTAILYDSWRKVWILPDGKLIKCRLTPFKTYSKILDYYEYDRNGNVIITGRYPNYFTDRGDRVYLDADGRMLQRDPGSIVERYQMLVWQRQKRRKIPGLLRTSKRRRSPKKTIDGFCEQCGTFFQTNKETRRFCSEKCRLLNLYQRKPLLQRVCEECGTTFMTKTNKRFCSKRCWPLDN